MGMMMETLFVFASALMSVMLFFSFVGFAIFWFATLVDNKVFEYQEFPTREQRLKYYLVGALVSIILNIPFLVSAHAPNGDEDALFWHLSLPLQVFWFFLCIPFCILTIYIYVLAWEAIKANEAAQIPPDPDHANPLEAAARFNAELRLPKHLKDIFAKEYFDWCVEQDREGKSLLYSSAEKHALAAANTVRLVPAYELLKRGSTPLLSLYWDYISEYNSDDSHHARMLDVIGMGEFALYFRNIRVSYTIPTDIRPEHHVIIAASGDGKTTLYESMIADDLSEDACIVVIDSQKTIIDKLTYHVDPSRIVLISPETLPALNLFAIGADDELAEARAMAMFDFIFESRGETFTTKQATVYRNLSRLCMKVPGASLATLRDMCDPGATADEVYAPYIAQLSENAQSFFRAFNLKTGNDYAQTKQEVQRRISAALESSTFSKMLGAKTMKLDILAEIEAGKVILVDTDYERLQASTALFGKLIIGLVLQAVQSRPPGTGKRVYLYIDEFGQDYAQDSELLLRCFTQARKANLALIVTIQGLSQLPEKLRAAISTNTAIKMAGTVSAEERVTVAKQLNTSPEVLANQPPYSFTAYFKRYGTMPWKVEPYRLQSFPTNSYETLQELRARMRRDYGEESTPPPKAPPEDDDFKEAF